MKVKEVTISLTKRELDILTMAIESYQDEIEDDEHKDEVDAVWDDLYELDKVFKKEEEIWKLQRYGWHILKSTQN